MIWYSPHIYHFVVNKIIIIIIPITRLKYQISGHDIFYNLWYKDTLLLHPHTQWAACEVSLYSPECGWYCPHDGSSLCVQQQDRCAPSWQLVSCYNGFAWNWCPFNSLWPCFRIWRCRSRSTSAQVMACCLTAPCHSLNLCWPIIIEKGLQAITWGQIHRQISILDMSLKVTTWSQAAMS